MFICLADHVHNGFGMINRNNELCYMMILIMLKIKIVSCQKYPVALVLVDL